MGHCHDDLPATMTDDTEAEEAGRIYGRSYARQRARQVTVTVTVTVEGARAHTLSSL